MMTQTTFSPLTLNHLCLEYVHVVGVTKICVIEDASNFIDVLDLSSNDEYINASNIQNHVYNYTSIVFSLAMVDDAIEDMR